MNTTINVYDAPDAPARAIEVKFYRGEMQCETVYPAQNEFFITDPDNLAFVTIESLAPGNWMGLLIPPFQSLAITLEALPTGQMSWWHELIGLQRDDNQRGEGVKVGVIDKNFERRPGDQSLAHVNVLGAMEPTGDERVENGLLPRDQHGTSIASLAFSRSTVAFQGIAPGSTAYFYAARLPIAHQDDDSDQTVAVSLVANGIQELTDDFECDIISVSAGDMQEEHRGLHRQIRLARKKGTLCFFGSGNKGGSLMYPALHPEVLSVGALGMRGFAPTSSFEYENNEALSETLIGDKYYLWEGSATGPTLKFVAPGSNIIWSYGDEPATAVCGTSWACPTAAATAAVILSQHKERWQYLPRDEARADAMLTILREHSWKMGLSESVVEHGLLRP